MLLGRVARMYYELGLTHQEIANTLGLSRVRVTRLLAEARDKGLVEIIVHVTDSMFASEERALSERYGLKQAWIAPSVSEGPRAEKAFATVGGDALGQVIDKGFVVALGLSTAVAQVVREFPKRSLEASFIPIAGSSPGLATGANPHELALELASRSEGQAFHLPAPLLAATPEAAASAYADPGVQDVLKKAASADVLIAGVGAMGTGQGILLSALNEEQRQDLVNRGAVGDIGGRFFDLACQPVKGPLDERIVGLSLEALMGIPTRVGVARGKTKTDSIRTALTGQLINMLVTDIDTARALLS